MHVVFVIYIFSTIVCSGACFNPYLRFNHEDTSQVRNEYDDSDHLGYRSYVKRSIDGDDDEKEANARESEFQNIDEPQSIYEDVSKLGELNSMEDDDIAMALSRLSVGELDTLDRFIDDESQAMGGYSAKGFKSKRCGHKKNSQHHADNSKKSKRMADESIFRRRNRVSRLTPDQRVDAKINFLRDKYKRQSELQRIEESMRRQKGSLESGASERDDFEFNDNVQNPYYNVAAESRTRLKRSSDLNNNRPLDNKNPMDDPKSAQHLRLLEESFPNPRDDDTQNNVDSLIRVKREML